METPEANHGRPAVSIPATLTPVGYLQFENGRFYAETSPEFHNAIWINQVIKFMVASHLQLLVHRRHLLMQVELPAMLSQAVSQARSSPDFRQSYCLGRGHKPAVSLSYIRRLYASPAPEIYIGTFRNSTLTLLSNVVGGFHFDINGILFPNRLNA